MSKFIKTRLRVECTARLREEIEESFKKITKKVEECATKVENLIRKTDDSNGDTSKPDTTDD